MSEESKNLATDNTADEPVEVDELDDQSLESASGGAVAKDISEVGDVNQLQCYC